ncbi:phosphate/phosphite/phosphonate ABC transporter substrate-binding protein [Wenzhouxiangella sp. XN201]|uniref:phosphate/phosphite/phosphonate ABC transporter substrate-binding protein n=1 Tax=Wenzhouxiangella sp. XN201 TaxID=2710755 RepID=UPI0013CD1C38|nr:phosphate/phosphite/phosphonate ABC transporter substrate-binding protein [Wenzhouxiangella sp. XN201]NEZ03158.1 phosphate/phosphite/phosphonate ABC transporter substrate-binding protein [Wenzhouxiangella sp. XN201]
MADEFPMAIAVRILGAVLAGLILAACCPRDQVDERGWPNELVLGLVPSLEAEAMVDNLDPLADFLSEELGMPVTSFVPQDYTGLVEALGTGRADIGMLPPFAAMLGQRRYDIKTVLISVREGETGYRSQFMTNDPSVCDSPVVEDERGYLTCEGDVQEMRGETVAFTDPNSTSGFLFPSLHLMDHGIDPSSDVDGIFVGGHDSAALAVYAGDVRFAVAYDDVRMFIDEQYPDIGQKVITFDHTVMIPNDGVQLRPGLPEDLQRAIAEAFVKLAESQAHLPREEKVLWILYEIDDFVPATEGLYDPVRDAYELLRE